ncbi:MAG: hypothetical protein ACXVP4_06445 [Bacteroidia bacterium]
MRQPVHAPLFILLFFLSAHSFGQTSNSYKVDSIKREINYTPYNHKGNYQTWAVKGKPLVWILGNGWGASGLLGAEHSFFKNHSIGIDGYFEFHTDNNDLNNTNYHGFEKAVFINYRYYLPFKNLREHKGIFLYTGFFVRHGQLTDTYDKGYYGGDDSLLVSIVKNYNSLGLLTGVLTNFTGDGGKFGVDFNIGWFINDKNYIKEFSDQPKATMKFEHTTYDMRIGLNLYWWFYRQKK